MPQPNKIKSYKFHFSAKQCSVALLFKWIPSNKNRLWPFIWSNKRKWKLQPCKVGGVLGLGRAEQFCTLSVHMLSCLYSTPGDSLAWVEVWRIEYSSPVAFFFGNTHHTHKVPVEVGDPTGTPPKNSWSCTNSVQSVCNNM